MQFPWNVGFPGQSNDALQKRDFISTSTSPMNVPRASLLAQNNWVEIRNVGRLTPVCSLLYFFPTPYSSFLPLATGPSPRGQVACFVPFAASVLQLFRVSFSVPRSVALEYSIRTSPPSHSGFNTQIDAI